MGNNQVTTGTLHIFLPAFQELYDFLLWHWRDFLGEPIRWAMIPSEEILFVPCPPGFLVLYSGNISVSCYPEPYLIWTKRILVAYFHLLALD